MGLLWMAAVLASWAFNALVYLVWRPRAITRQLRDQGVGGPVYKNVGNPHIARLLGKGLVLTDGDDWKRHRKVVHPAFNMDKLKMMTVTMSDCAGSMMSEWKAKMEKGGDMEIELSSQFEELTADVISHTAFGSSYEQGKKGLLGAEGAPVSCLLRRI